MRFFFHSLFFSKSLFDARHSVVTIWCAGHLRMHTCPEHSKYRNSTLLYYDRIDSVIWKILIIFANKFEDRKMFFQFKQSDSWPSFLGNEATRVYMCKILLRGFLVCIPRIMEVNKKNCGHQEVPFGIRWPQNPFVCICNNSQISWQCEAFQPANANDPRRSKLLFNNFILPYHISAPQTHTWQNYKFYTH